MVAAGAAAMADDDIFRMYVRRLGLLDGTGVLDDDLALRERIERLFAQAMTMPRPPSGPSRDEMLILADEAVGK